MSGYPASIIVGTCGKASIRLLVESPSALSLPAWMKLIADDSVTNMICVSPPSIPVTAGPAPPL